MGVLNPLREDNTCSLGEGTPTAFTMNSDVINELLVFLLGPRAFVGAFFVTARFSHCFGIASLPASLGVYGTQKWNKMQKQYAKGK